MLVSGLHSLEPAFVSSSSMRFANSTLGNNSQVSQTWFVWKRIPQPHEFLSQFYCCFAVSLLRHPLYATTHAVIPAAIKFRPWWPSGVHVTSSSTLCLVTSCERRAMCFSTGPSAPLCWLETKEHAYKFQTTVNFEASFDIRRRANV